MSIWYFMPQKQNNMGVCLISGEIQKFFQRAYCIPKEMELSYSEPIKNTIYGGAVYMKLHELVDMANEYGKYVLGVIEDRELDDYSLMCTVDTYERAKEYEKQLNADGIMDIIIVPPFHSDKVKPNETADYFRSYYNQQVHEPAVKYRWTVKL